MVKRNIGAVHAAFCTEHVKNIPYHFLGCGRGGGGGRNDVKSVDGKIAMKRERNEQAQRTNGARERQKEWNICCEGITAAAELRFIAPPTGLDAM
jgi:hypothetical protein